MCEQNQLVTGTSYLIKVTVRKAMVESEWLIGYKSPIPCLQQGVYKNTW